MQLDVSPAEVAKAVIGAVTGGAIAVGVLARHLSKVQRTLTGTEKRDPNAPSIAAQLAEVQENTSHTAGEVDQISTRLGALEGRLDEAARDHAEEIGRVKGRLEGIEGQVATVQRHVHTLGGRVEGLERAKGWTPRRHGDPPSAEPEG